TSPPEPEAASRAAASRSRTARSTRNSSSPTISVTGATSVAGGGTAVRAAIDRSMPCPRGACPTDAAARRLVRDRLAAEPDTARGQAVGPDEGTLVVGVPQDH